MGDSPVCTNRNKRHSAYTIQQKEDQGGDNNCYEPVVGHHQWGLDEDESRGVGTFLLFTMHDKPKTSPFHCHLHLDRFGTSHLNRSHQKEHYKWVCTTQEPFKVGICASEYTCTTDCHGGGASSNQVRARDVRSQPAVKVEGVQNLIWPSKSSSPSGWPRHFPWPHLARNPSSQLMKAVWRSAHGDIMQAQRLTSWLSLTCCTPQPPPLIQVSESGISPHNTGQVSNRHCKFGYRYLYTVFSF